MPDLPTVRVLVTGSRTWPDEDALWRPLDILTFALIAPAELTLVHGACPRGADAMAAAWAEDRAGYMDNRGITIREERHPADWDRHGKRAGFVRNAEMVDLGADVCLAFIHAGSRGAMHTAALAEKAGIDTRRYLA